MKLSRHITTIVAILTLVGSVFTQISPVHAILSSDATCSINDGGCTYYEADDQCDNGSDNTTGSVYILGDSVTSQSNTAYTQAFKTAGLTATINSGSGRSLTTPGGGETGLQAISDDSNEISQASSIVIALGTNNVGNSVTQTSQQIDQAISTIRAINLSAPIYWVDTFVLGRPDYNQNTIAVTNQAIYGQAASQNYKVLSWANVVDKGINPQKPSNNNYNDADPHNYINNTDGLGFNPTPAGSTALAALVAGSLTAQTSTQQSGSTCCNDTTTENFGPGTLPSYIKAPYNAIFTAAGKKFNIDPGVLVGIFYNEQYGYQNALSEFSQHNMPKPPPPYGNGPPWAFNTASNGSGDWPPGSPAAKEGPVGARGPFQFEPGTWAEHGVDGNGDGKKDALDLTDESFGAANYLASLGATNPESESKIEHAATSYSGGYPQYSQNTFEIFKKIKNDEGGSAATPGDSSGGGGDTSSSDGSGCPNTTTSGSNIYQDPFHDQSRVGASRVDSGADFYAIGAPVPVYAIGDGEIDIATAHGTFYPPNPGWISYRLTDPKGSAYHKYVYVSEGCPPQPGIAAGVTVHTNTILCYMQPSSIEMGWAQNGTEQLAMAYGHYVESYATIYGQNFTEMLNSLGLKVKECYDHPGSSLNFGSPPVPSELPPAWVPNPETRKEGSNACSG